MGIISRVQPERKKVLNLADHQAITDAAGIMQGLLHSFIRFLFDLPS